MRSINLTNYMATEKDSGSVIYSLIGCLFGSNNKDTSPFIMGESAHKDYAGINKH